MYVGNVRGFPYAALVLLYIGKDAIEIIYNDVMITKQCSNTVTTI